MTPEAPPSPQCEVGHLEFRVPDNTTIFKYIVALQGVVHRLFADDKWGSHWGVANDMKKKKLLDPADPIKGGGKIKITMSNGVLTELSLYDTSGDFGREPEEVRTALRPLVLAKLKEIGIDISGVEV
jgi:hypothetical protein